MEIQCRMVRLSVAGDILNVWGLADFGTLVPTNGQIGGRMGWELSRGRRAYRLSDMVFGAVVCG